MGLRWILVLISETKWGIYVKFWGVLNIKTKIYSCKNNSRVEHRKNAFVKGNCLDFSANIVLNNFACVMDLFISLLRSRTSLQCFLSLSWANIFSLFRSKSWREVYKKWDDKSKNWNHLFLFSCFKRKMPGELGIYRKFKFVIENKKCICGLKKKYWHVTLKLWYLQYCTVSGKMYYIRGYVTL